ncbi:MAG TPA: FRG domain-containing protein [Blastocatellia bacterium]|nr:FRG domain-containing protein [Blastocatellia bacterium]
MEEIRVESWDDFVDRVSALDDWAFRGHRDAGWPLLSSLSRHLQNFVPDRTRWQEREARAIRIFRRKAHNYLSDLGTLEDDVRCVALMQHHGAPTRLLDFTKSPYVAAFFALERATDEAAVFALNTPLLWQAAPKHRPELTRSVIDPRIRGNFEKYFAGNDHEVVWTGEPKQMDRRLVAQSGTFVMPGVLDKSLDEILAQYEADEPLLKKLTLPARIRSEGMRALYRMNITTATLFPDLDGLARSLAFELEIVWRGVADQTSME